MNYYVERIGQVLVTFAGALFIAYALYRFMPGSPEQAIVSQEIQRQLDQNPGATIDTDQVRRRAERVTGIDPDTGVVDGFIQYVGGMVFDQEFGTSIAYSEPVFSVVGRHLPWSVFLSGYGLLFGFSLTLIIGTAMAWKEGSKTDSALTVFIIGSTSIPYFVVGVLMLGIIGFGWGLLPTGGRYPATADPGFNLEFMRGVVAHAIMPIASTLLVGMTGALYMRANTVRIMGSEYIRSGEIRGVSRNRLITRYLMRNSILPIYTGLMVGIAGVFSSNVVTEFIFQYPAMGWILIEALNFNDYPLLMGTFVFFTTVTVLGLLIADLTYGIIDPRAKTGDSREAF